MAARLVNNPLPAALPQGSAGDLVEVWKQYQAAREAYRTFGRATAQEKDDAPYALVRAAEDTIYYTPSHSMSDALTKLRLLHDMLAEDIPFGVEPLHDVLAYLTRAACLK